MSVLFVPHKLPVGTNERIPDHQIQDISSHTPSLCFLLNWLLILGINSEVGKLS